MVYNLEIKNGVIFTYLYAEGKPFAIHKDIGIDGELYYLHLDNQGSLMAISDNAGAVIERRSYDAWGRPRNPENWEYNLGMAFGGAGQGITMRGYTMHEHLEMFSLINMNGRLYDPMLGRMLSPDNYIQAPNNTQSYNRYSYCVNNPLKYTDPSGNIWGLLAGLGGAYLGGVGANGGEFNPYKWNYSNPNTYLGMGIGFAVGYVGATALPGTEFNINANISGVTLPMARITSNSIDLGLGDDAYGGYLGSSFVRKHNRKNSGGDETACDEARMEYVRYFGEYKFFRSGIYQVGSGANFGRIRYRFSNFAYGGVELAMSYSNKDNIGNYKWFQTVNTNTPIEKDGPHQFIDSPCPPYYNNCAYNEDFSGYEGGLMNFYDTPNRNGWSNPYMYWIGQLSLINTDTYERIVTFNYGFIVTGGAYGYGSLYRIPLTVVIPNKFHLDAIPKKQ